MAKKSSCSRFVYFIASIFPCLFLSPSASAQPDKTVPENLPAMVAKFKDLAKQPCGQRAEALRMGENIVSAYGTDRANFNVVQSVIAQLAAIEKEDPVCKKNMPGKTLGELYEDFIKGRAKPCGDRAATLQTGREILLRFGDEQLNKAAVDFVREDLPLLEAEEKACQEENSLASLFDQYKILRREPCGSRSKAIEVGERIIAKYREDRDNQPVINYVLKDVAAVKKEDPSCSRFALYNQAYKEKNWKEFFNLSKQIIDEEKDKSLKLDVMLTLVSVGYRLTAYEKTDSYNTDIFNYAKKALELIDSDVGSAKRWGIHEPFGTKEKALGWVNFIAGYVGYFRLKENKKAIPYFYKSTLYKAEFKYDAFVYQAVAMYYFDKEAVSVSSLTIHDFITKASNLDALKDPTLTKEERTKNWEIVVLYRQLLNLYNLRYNLAPGEYVTGLTDYIQKLIDRPLIDNAASKIRPMAQKY